jgi:hypothetical protein
MSKEIIDALNGQFDELKKANEELIASEVKGLGVADLKEKMDNIDAKLDVSEAKLEEEKAKAAELEAKTAKYEEQI